LKINPIICSNDLSEILDKIQDILQKNSIKSVKLVDQSDDQVVILISDKEITEEQSKIWWAGYQAAIGAL